MSEAHSRLGPSAAPVWGSRDGCRGSVRVLAAYPDRSTQAAEEGTAFHELLKLLADGAGHPSSFVGRLASNGVEWTSEMARHAQDLADRVRRLRLASPGCSFWSETRVHARTLIHPELWGTADLTVYAPGVQTLYLWDAKWGHVPVDAFENLQLACYAAGAIETFGIPCEGLKLRMEIFQPRDYVSQRKAPNVWELPMDEFVPYVLQLREAAREAMDPQAPVRSGPQCKYCDARLRCRAAIESGLRQHETTLLDATVDHGDPLQLSNLLSVVRRAKERIEALDAALTAEVESCLRGRRDIPGWQLAQRTAHLQWTAEYETMLALGEASGVDLRKRELLTPNQAIESGIDPEIVKALSERPPGKLSLQPVDSKYVRRLYEQ